MNNFRNFNTLITTNKLNDNEKERLFWQMVNDINWSEDDNEHSMSTYLQLNYDMDTILDLQRLECDKRLEMEKCITNYLRSLDKAERNKFTLDNDGIFDLASHIVGMGKVMYNYVLDNPSAIFNLQNHYKSCFEYGFDDAVFALTTNE